MSCFRTRMARWSVTILPAARWWAVRIPEDTLGSSGVPIDAWQLTEMLGGV